VAAFQAERATSLSSHRFVGSRRVGLEITKEVGEWVPEGTIAAPPGYDRTCRNTNGATSLLWVCMASRNYRASCFVIRCTLSRKSEREAVRERDRCALV
jgi:hypothetical protein